MEETPARPIQPGISTGDRMTQLLYDPVDLSNYAKRGLRAGGTAPIEEWPGIPVGRERIMASAGEGSYRDNLFVERLWRDIKYEEVYLKAYADGRDARAGIGEYLSFYNTQRPHQALGYRTPWGRYSYLEVEETWRPGPVRTSPMTSTLGSIRAVHDLNLASYLSS